MLWTVFLLICFTNVFCANQSLIENDYPWAIKSGGVHFNVDDKVSNFTSKFQDFSIKPTDFDSLIGMRRRNTVPTMTWNWLN